MAVHYYVDDDQVIYLKDVLDADGDPITDATVTYTIESMYTFDGAVQVVGSGTLAYNSERGRFERAVPQAENDEMVVGRRYIIKYTVVTFDGANSRPELVVDARTKRRR